MRVGVIGAGAWGTTVAALFAPRAETTLWAREPEVVAAVQERRENTLFLPDIRLPDELSATTSLPEALERAEAVVVGVPAQHLRSTMAEARASVPPDVPVLSLSKGIEEGSLLRMTEVLGEVLADHPSDLIGVLSGPNLAREVASAQPSATVVAFGEHGVAARLQAVLTTEAFRVYTSTDLVGCETGGAVKNVMAIATGMADGMGYGWNTRAALITRGLAEMTRLGVALGGEAHTFLGLAGSGDLMATCSSTESRNHHVGFELAGGRALDDVLAGTATVAEGVRSTPGVVELARRAGVEMPIVEQVGAVLAGERRPHEVAAHLMRREPKPELADLHRGPAGDA